MVLRLVVSAVKRKENVTVKTKTSITKREEKRREGKREPTMRRMRAQNQTRKLGCPFPLCVTSELGTKCIDERLLKKDR